MAKKPKFKNIEFYWMKYSFDLPEIIWHWRVNDYNIKPFGRFEIILN